LIFEYISEHIFKSYFTQLTWLCLDVCDVGFRSRSQVLLWNMNSKLVPSIGPDAPEAVSVLRQIRDRKLIHFIRVRSVSNGLSGQFGWDGPSARQRHMHRLKKNILHLARLQDRQPLCKALPTPNDLYRRGLRGSLRSSRQRYRPRYISILRATQS